MTTPLYIYSIATDDVNPFYTVNTKLDGISYTFQFIYMSRQHTYVITLSDGNGLICCFKPVVGIDLLAPYRYNERCPPGFLTVICSSASDDTSPDIGELGIGDRTVLSYISLNSQ